MHVDQIAERMAEAREAYYNGSPIVTDAVYDSLEDQLKKLDPHHPILKQIGAPTPSGGAWPKVKHGQRMSSLNKAQDIGDLKAWFTKNQVTDLYVTEKLDGISVSLRYEKGIMVQALTRGDGDIGEDITRNVLLMKGYPKQGADLTGYVRGEIVVLKSDFAAHFPGESNPRNTASGTSKRQSNQEKCKHLTVMAYQFLPDSGNLISKMMELKALTVRGFTVPNSCAGTSVQWAEGYYDQYIATTRDGLDYEIDGLVLDVNGTSAREALGDHNNRPAGAIALKFPHESKETILRDIRWQVGKSGRITPVAMFDTVALVGANVSKASLHNVGYYAEIAKQLGEQVLGFGDTILVSRRNDVIPAVEAGIKANSDPTVGRCLLIPTECPACKATLSMEGAYLLCTNGLACPAQVAGAVSRWVKKVGILDWGDSVIDALCANGMVSSPADLYTIQDDDLADVQLSGRRVGSSSKKMLDNLHAKKDLPLHVIIGSLGIPLIGRSMAHTISLGGYDTLDKMFKATEHQIASISGVGTSKAKTFVEGMDKGISLVCQLLANGVTISKPASNGPLKSKLVCLTGFRDPGMVAAIEAQGGVVKSSVSKKLDYLVMKDPTSTSGKAKKARGYGTNIVSVDDMNTLLGR